MDDLNKYINEQLKDTQFKKEFERTRPEFEVTKAMIQQSNESNITQLSPAPPQKQQPIFSDTQKQNKIND